MVSNCGSEMVERFSRAGPANIPPQINKQPQTMARNAITRIPPQIWHRTRDSVSLRALLLRVQPVEPDGINIRDSRILNERDVALPLRSAAHAGRQLIPVRHTTAAGFSEQLIRVPREQRHLMGVRLQQHPPRLQ